MQEPATRSLGKQKGLWWATVDEESAPLQCPPPLAVTPCMQVPQAVPVGGAGRGRLPHRSYPTASSSPFSPTADRGHGSTQNWGESTAHQPIEPGFCWDCG